MANEFGVNGLANQLTKALNECPTYDKLPQNWTEDAQNKKMAEAASEPVQKKEEIAEQRSVEEKYSNDYSFFAGVDGKLYIYMLVPGRKKENISVSIVDDCWLDVKADAIDMLDQKFSAGDARWMAQKKFMVNLGSNVDLTSIKTSLNDGILTVEAYLKQKNRINIAVE